MTIFVFNYQKLGRKSSSRVHAVAASQLTTRAFSSSFSNYNMSVTNCLVNSPSHNGKSQEEELVENRGGRRDHPRSNRVFNVSVLIP